MSSKSVDRSFKWSKLDISVQNSFQRFQGFTQFHVFQINCRIGSLMARPTGNHAGVPLIFSS